MSDREVFSDKLKPVKVLEEEFADVDDKPSMLDTEDELKEEEVLDEEEEEVLEGNSNISIFTRAASILSHFLLLHCILSFLEKSLSFTKMRVVQT